MNLTEKSAYIKGLIEGMDLNEDKDEVKTLKAIADLLEDITLTVADLEQISSEHDELFSELDEDLGEVEELLYCSDDSRCLRDTHDEFEDETYELTCPNCNEVIELDYEMFGEGEIKCPNCGENLELDLSGLVDEEFEDED